MPLKKRFLKKKPTTMEKPGSSKTELIELRNFILLLLALWTSFVGIILLWGLAYQKDEIKLIAQLQAQNSFEKDLVYRRWAARHGGVYVPMTDKTPPNPNLSHIKERDISTPSGRTLTLVNPAYMTRQVHELGLEQHGLRGHITSLTPLRHANAPDEWETKQLRAFEQSVKEVYSLEKIDNQSYMRYMHPMIIEQSCLKCHAEQGYKTGDLHGGISVSVPMAPIQVVTRGQMLRHAEGLFVLWLLGVAGIVLAGQRFKHRIQEHIYVEEALFESNAKYQDLYDSAPDMFVSVDAKTANIIDCNNTLRNKLGYAKEEIIGRSVFDIYAPDSSEYAKANVFPEFLKTGTIEDQELQLQRKDGNKIDVSLNASAVRDKDGGILFSRSVWRDITRRKGVETALKKAHNDLERKVRERTAELTHTNEFLRKEITERKWADEIRRQSEEKYRGIFDDSIATVYVLDKKKRFIDSNQAGLDLLGYPMDELLNMSISDVHADPVVLLPAHKQLLSGENIVNYEHQLKRKDGMIITVLNNSIPLTDADGNIIGIQSTLIDITERKQTEQKLHDYQQRLKALVSQLTVAEERERRNVAADLHDLIGHSLALARMQLEAVLSAASKAETTLLVNDISNILLKAIKDTKNLIYELSSPLMHEIGLGAAIYEWLEEYIERRYGLETDFIDEISGRLKKSMDENERAILFRNVRELLTNVVKHAQAKKVTVYLKNDGAAVNVVIEDDGIGFDPFDAIKPGKGSTGFGLFSINERMTDLGGGLEIQSQPGKGCRAILTVPVGEEGG